MYVQSTFAKAISKDACLAVSSKVNLKQFLLKCKRNEVKFVQYLSPMLNLNDHFRCMLTKNVT